MAINPQKYMESRLVGLLERLDQDWEIVEGMLEGSLKEGKSTPLDCEALLSYYRGISEANAILDLYNELYASRDSQALQVEKREDRKVIEEALTFILRRLVDHFNKGR